MADKTPVEGVSFVPEHGANLRTEECRCDQYCGTCGEYTLNDDFECQNDSCSDNSPNELDADCPRGCGEIAHRGACKE